MADPCEGVNYSHIEKETVINSFNSINSEFIGLKDPILTQLSQV